LDGRHADALMLGSFGKARLRKSGDDAETGASDKPRGCGAPGGRASSSGIHGRRGMQIESVAVLGAGTMGSGIAALCAQAGCRVALLDVSRPAAEQAVARMLEARPPMLDDPARAELIAPGSFDDDLPAAVGSADWVCEAIIEDLATKRALFGRLEPLRREGSVVSSNTSGILLRTITEGLPLRLRRDIAVTHFFNPVKVMKLVELVPGADTRAEVIQTAERFLAERLGKGVVHAKDTVNFIGNRIGCFWMLSGLHKAHAGLADGLTMEEIDALLAAPVGIPPTGLYGLLDLIGLDVLALVAKNLAANLPAGDAGLAYARLPPIEQAMVERGQLGRKAGGGFYRLLRHEDGTRSKEVFDLRLQSWRAGHDVSLAPEHADPASLLFDDSPQGSFAWDVMGGTLCYAAELIPEIADDVVNVDRAMRWGFNWAKGPFELLDALGPARVAERLEAAGQPLPRMIEILRGAGAERFYREDGACLGADGAYRPLP
jgi:3-hydroxyacyl-CoA dehydrogenase